MLKQLIKRFLNEGMIEEVNEIARGVYGITISSPAIHQMKYTVGQHLRFYLGDQMEVSGKDALRTYSIWSIDQAEGKIQLAICSHAVGPGSVWIRLLNKGDKVYFSQPKGKLTLDATFDKYLFVGDPSSLAHLYELRRNLDAKKKIKGVIYSNDKSKLFADIDGNYPFTFYELQEAPTKSILKILETELEQEDEKIMYVAGDGRICVDVNKYLKKEKNWNRRSIKAKPFWMPEKTGLE